MRQMWLMLAPVMHWHIGVLAWEQFVQASLHWAHSAPPPPQPGRALCGVTFGPHFPFPPTNLPAFINLTSVTSAAHCMRHAEPSTGRNAAFHSRCAVA